MPMIVWRDKLLAFGVHFLATLVVAACAAAVIFLVWFPDPFQTMVRGTELFMLVVGCDLALGPLLSLVVFDRRKKRRELVFDYSIIVIVQIAALLYGVYTVYGSRPVYVAYVADRLEVVLAMDIKPAELIAARDPKYKSLPLDGPHFVSVVVSPADHNDALFAALAGNPESTRPRFYVPYEQELVSIRAHAKPLTELKNKHAEALEGIDRAVARSEKRPEDLAWLPVSTRRGFWTALLDAKTGYPVGYFPLDPY